MPKYLTKEELKQILSYLDDRVDKAMVGTKKAEKYNAYLYRAIIWFLYTTGLRNAELRILRMQDLNLDEHVGAVLGKGNKYAAITFSETARQHLTAYLKIRSKIFPGIKFGYVFTSYTYKADARFSAS